MQGLSLRLRLVFALAAAVLPFAIVLVFANLWVYRPLQDDVQQLSDQMQRRFEDVANLQLLLARSAMPPNDYLIHGGQDERVRFELLAGRIESALKNLRQSVDPDHPSEVARVAEMLERWASAHAMGVALLQWDRARPVAEAARDMEAFDRRIDDLTEEAEALLAHVRVELEEARTRAVRRRHDLNRFVALSTVVAGILTVFLVAYLGRVITGPAARRPGARRGKPVKEAGRGDANGDAEPGERASPYAGGLQAIDPATRMWSRGSLQEQLATETERAMVLDTPSSLMLIQVDQFGDILEQLGAPAADAMLATVAERIRHVVRQTDFPARSGEAEFAVLMPATDLALAVEIAQRICAHVAETSLTAANRAIAITVSVGVAGDAVARSGHAGASTLLGRADQAVHRARRAGGNRVASSGRETD